MGLRGDLRWSRNKKLGEDLIALAGKRQILFRNSPFIMCAERQYHLVKANINVRMMIAFLSFLVNSVNKSDTF